MVDLSRDVSDFSAIYNLLGFEAPSSVDNSADHFVDVDVPVPVDGPADLSTSALLFEDPMPLHCFGETIESPPAGDIDSDGGIIPEADISSTDDETSTNARVRRNSEKRRICRRVRVQRAVARIEESEQPRFAMQPKGSDADGCLSDDARRG